MLQTVYLAQKAPDKESRNMKSGMRTTKYIKERGI